MEISMTLPLGSELVFAPSVCTSSPSLAQQRGPRTFPMPAAPWLPAAGREHPAPCTS